MFYIYAMYLYLQAGKFALNKRIISYNSTIPFQEASMAQCPSCGKPAEQRIVTIKEPADTEEKEYLLNTYKYEPLPGEYTEYFCESCGYILEKK